MSVASEFAPEVFIPERARRGEARVRHLAVVPEPIAAASFDDIAPARLCAEELSVVSAPLRLTRRGIAVLVVGTVLAGALLLLVAHASLGAAPSSARSDSSVAGSVTVQPGDTLWSIAQRVDPSADPRRTVDHLRRVNHLGSVDLSAGQTLKLG